MSTAPCPACGGDRGRVVREVGAREAAQHFVLAEAAPERHAALALKIGTLWEQETCRVVECPACGFFYADPYVGGDREFYALAYDRSGYPQEKWEHRAVRDAIATLPERPRTLLEVGAGDGAFLRMVVPSIFRRDDVLATEYSDYGRRAIVGLGIRCEALDVRALPSCLDGTFDAICLFQVIEHLDRTDETFARLAGLARGGSRLFMSVPNDAQIGFNERHGALLDMPPNHIGRWTREAFRITGARHGWRLITHAVESEPFVSMARRFLVYRHLRAGQRSGSVPNRIRALRCGALRTVLDAAWIGATLPRALFALARLRVESGGDSQLVAFVRERPDGEGR